MNFRFVSLLWVLAALSLVFPVFSSWSMHASSGLDNKALATAVAQATILVAAVLYAAFSPRFPTLSFFLASTCGFTLWVLSSFAVTGGVLPTRASAIVFFVIGIWSALELVERNNSRRSTYLS
ncbi:hypothetical protein [Corynebacterium liangguodongii]|uniref:Uncharacterized protein n=1 Tax=Corynebacterium liangguodongii TaxID=2079535 RepID=A0A2S0WC51_9CORY|nr:hypothetical protein [Corynebacterium liangguodongii]AWB83351.1 hypothetical protein C3E79_01660 [Corynebacterium liangguodongii]PWC00559.1 hypothetical protein DF219_01290 [Corynebacterium liangguodongii]